MKIFCENCENTTDFTLIRTVELGFNHKKGKWDESNPTIGREVIYCRECDNDQDSVKITVEK